MVALFDNKGYKTQFDGKNTSHCCEHGVQNCNVCGAKPSEMSVPGREYVVEDKSKLDFGFTNLHAGIRFVEFQLHLSYLKEIKVRQVLRTNAAHVKSRDKRKKFIQETLYDNYGKIRVDEV